MHNVDLDQLGTKDVLRLYADILTLLIKRGVVRSRNAPVGDLAESLTARAYDGVLAPQSAKSWDVLSAGGLRLQVKARLIVAGSGKAGFYSPFRSWDFDACVFLLLDAHTYEVTSAVELPVAAVRELAREAPWVRGFRIGTRAHLASVSGAVDRTAAMIEAFDRLDEGPTSL